MGVLDAGNRSFTCNRSIGSLLFHDGIHVHRSFYLSIFFIASLFIVTFYPFPPFSYGAVFKRAILLKWVIISSIISVLNHRSQKLAIALGRLFEGPPGHRDQTFHKADQQALCSLISFIAGSFIGRFGDKIGPTKRIWLMTGCFITTLFTMAAAIAFWKSGQPSIASDRAVPAWTDALSFVGLGFMSASLGLQGILAKRLNTQFGTSSV